MLRCMLRYSPGFVVALVLVAGCAPSGMADLADELGCKKIKDHPKGLYVPPGATLVADCYLGGKDVATITWFDNDNNKARDRYVEDVDGLTTDGFVVGDH